MWPDTPPRMPAMLPILMMLPLPCLSITGATCLIPSKTPRTLTASNWSIVAASISVMLTMGAGKRGVVDQAIDAAEPADGPIDHGLHVGLVRHVGADEADAEAFFQRGAFVLPARGDDDFGALLDKKRRDAFADAARPAGDDGNFSLQRAHSNLPTNRFRDSSKPVRSPP